MPYTNGFETPDDLRRHYMKHRTECGATSQEHYQLLADTFLGGPKDTDTYECIRGREGDILRYKMSTDEFGILRPDNIIRTYYILDPARLRGRTGWDYFQAECAK